MSALVTGISIERGTCFDWIIDITSGDNGDPYDLTDTEVTGRISRTFDNEVQAYFDCQITNATGGVLNLSLNAEQTNNLDLAPCYWDLFVGPSGECPIKLLTGPVYISGSNWYE